MKRAGLWGTTELARVHVANIRIAESRLRADLVAVADAAATKHAYESDGLFGVGLLNAALVSLDFTRGELRWEN